MNKSRTLSNDNAQVQVFLMCRLTILAGLVALVIVVWP